MVHDFETEVVTKVIFTILALITNTACQLTKQAARCSQPNVTSDLLYTQHENLVHSLYLDCHLFLA